MTHQPVGRYKTLLLLEQLVELKRLSEECIQNIKDWELAFPRDANPTLTLGERLREIQALVKDRMVDVISIAQERDSARDGHNDS